MSISSAFAAGRTAVNQAEAQRLGLLSALINRPVAKARGAAMRGGGGGGGHQIESFEDQDAREAAEARKASDQAIQEEKHGQAMERGELELDIVRQVETERETAASNAAKDKEIADLEDISAGQIREGAKQDMLGYQEQMRHYKAYSDAIYRGDAAAADRHFRGVYPGMGGDTGTASVKRQLRDAEGKPVLDENGEPVMKETQYGAEGKAMTEGEFQKQQAGYPKHRSDGGVVYLQFGDEAPMPIGPGTLRQMHTSIHPSMMKQAGDGQAGGGKGATSVKTTAETAYKKMQTGTALYKAAAEIATKTPPPQKEGEEYDLMDPPIQTGQQWQKAFNKALVDINTYANSDKILNAQTFTTKTPLGKAMSKKAAKKAVELVHKMRKDGLNPKREQIEKSLSAEYGLPTAHYFTKYMGAAELTPDNLPFPGGPNKPRDLGNGINNVLHYYDKENELGVLVDKTVGRFMYHDRNQKAWVSMDPAAQRAFTTILSEKANEGDKTAQSMLELLNAQTQQELRPKAAISDTQETDSRAMPASQMAPQETSEAMDDRTSMASKFLEEQANLPQEEKDRRIARKKKRDEKTFLRRSPYATGQ